MENHPIYLTLSKQKELILSQISQIETDLPNIPNTQRTLENLKRELEIFSSVLSDLSSQELALGMDAASSTRNVRIINKASVAKKTFPNLLIYLFSILSTFLCYLYLLARHFLGERLTNFDALIDYVGKDMVLGEFPLVPKKQNKDKLVDSIANELLNKTIYEITHSAEDFKSIAIVGSNKDVGKTEIAKKIFDKLKLRNKVCLLDLDYRKKSLSKEISGENKFKNFDEFYQNRNDYTEENGSLFIPSFEVDTPSHFFTSDEFKNEISKLVNEFDFILCDTPPGNFSLMLKLFQNYLRLKFTLHAIN